MHVVGSTWRDPDARYHSTFLGFGSIALGLVLVLVLVQPELRSISEFKLHTATPTMLPDTQHRTTASIGGRVVISLPQTALENSRRTL